ARGEWVGLVGYGEWRCRFARVMARPLGLVGRAAGCGPGDGTSDGAKMVLARLGAFWATLAATALAPAAAVADKPQEWEWGFQEPATPVMEAVVQLHDKLLWIIILISVFVLGLLVYVMVRFSEKRNPTPSRTTHNTTIEVLWTVIPVLILLFIAFGPPMSSFRLLYLADRAPDAAMTVKAIGHQWYWSYEYPD